MLSVGPRTVKYTVSDKYGHTQKCNLSVLDLKIPFLSKFGPKNQKCHFKLKFGTKTNLNMQNSMVAFTFSISDGKTLFSQIWFKKPKLFVY